jgi:hypothetical protein
MGMVLATGLRMILGVIKRASFIGPSISIPNAIPGANSCDRGCVLRICVGVRKTIGCVVNGDAIDKKTD